MYIFHLKLDKGPATHLCVQDISGLSSNSMAFQYSKVSRFVMIDYDFPLNKDL